MTARWGKVWIAVAGWVAGAVTATAVGLFALSAIDLGPMSRTSVLPPQESATEITGSPTPSPQGSPGTGPNGVPPDGPVERILTSAGGSVVARCTAAGAYLVSWSPAQGYKAEGVHRGPAVAARVEFEHHDGGRLELIVRCVNGTPQLTVARGG